MLGEKFQIDNPQVFLAVLGILILIMTVFRFGRVRARRKLRAAESASAQPAPTAAEAKRAADDLQQVLLQIHDVAREIEARLDTRIRFAKRLIEEAESKLDELAARLAEVRVDEAVPVRRAAPVAAVAAYKANELLTVEATGPTSRPEPLSDTARVAQLAGEGMSAISIARELGRPIGEVELMLSLHRQSRSEDSP
ncbi:MAG: hypothetical protein AB7O52_15745 [Planctomycetota bacterium]